MDPEKWLADFQAQMADLEKKAVGLQENVAAATATASSRAGSVTVTVGPNGGLQDLQLGPRACDLGPAKLTAAILDAVRKAQREASEKVVAAFEPLGEGTEAMEIIMDVVPEATDADGREEPLDRCAPAAPVPVATRPRRRRAIGDDEEFEYRPW